MQLHHGFLETKCGQWLSRDLPEDIKQVLAKNRPRPDRFWIVDNSMMNTPGYRAYNPSIIQGGGKTMMAFRRHSLDDHSEIAMGVASHIVVCDLDENFRKSSNHRIVSSLVGPNSEDPRLFHHRDAIHLSYTSALYAPGNVWECMMQCAQLTPDSSSALLHYDNRFGVNGASHEKNWTYFSHGGMLRFVYNIEPFIAFEVETRRIWYHRHNGEWIFGVPHGGTPPVKVGDLWISFFHSHRRHPIYKRQYFVGAYAFDDNMKVRRFTPWPIMVGDASDGFCFDINRTTWSPVVALPCGSIFDGNTWTVSVGINDSYCGLFQVSHESLMSEHLREVVTS